MVTIIKTEKRQSEDGKEFYSLIIESGVEMVRSKATGNFYATTRRTSIPSTFDQVTAQNLIGKQIPGTIEKQACDPYEVINEETGEAIQLHHQYVYMPEATSEVIAGSKEEVFTLSPEQLKKSVNGLMDLQEA